MKKLLEKPGKSVKTIAIVLWIVEALASLIGAIVYYSSNTFGSIGWLLSNGGSRVWALFGITLAIGIGGIFIATVFNLLIYSFGCAVEDISEIKNGMSSKSEK